MHFFREKVKSKPSFTQLYNGRHCVVTTLVVYQFYRMALCHSQAWRHVIKKDKKIGQ